MTKVIGRLRRSPSVALFLVAPLVELVSGSLPPLEYFHPLVFIVVSLLYGCGALLVHEALVRWRKGWPSLLLLGAAYGIYEEGIVVRSFFDPDWVDLGVLGTYGRAAGVNWVWSVHLIQFHALMSIAASVVLVGLLYPDRRAQPWLNRQQIRWATLGLLSLLVIGPLVNPYTPPMGWFALTWALMGALIWAAWRAPARLFPPRERAVPRPRRFWALGFAGMTAFFLVVYGVAENHSIAPVALLVLLALADALALALVLRWSGNGAAWDDRHKLALVAGALWLFVLSGLAQEAEGVFGMAAVSVALALALEWLARRVRRRLREGVARSAPITPPQPA